MDTHTHPNWAVHPVTGDRYSAYNKPASIIHWLEHAKPTAEYVIILDADMVIRRPMTAELVEAERGRPVSAHYGYLKGVFPENYMKVKERVKNVEKAQQVGGFSVMHLEDLKQVAPLWLKWTEEVRNDPESWGNTGDIFNSNGKAGPPWISEMYGYVFACAEVGLNFKVSDKFMLYPGYAPPAVEPWPVVMHYGITYYVGEYAFDKHWYMATDMTSCPGRLFQRPPTLASLRLEPGSAEERRADVALSVAWGLYNATRQHAIADCGVLQPEDPPAARYRCSTNENNIVLCSQKSENDPPEELPPALPPLSVSPAVQTLAAPSPQRGADGAPCEDSQPQCCSWAAKGECESNPNFMGKNCAKACALCPGGQSGCASPQTSPGRLLVESPVETLAYPPPPAVDSTTAPVITPPRTSGSVSASLSPPATGEEEHVDPALRPQTTAPEKKLMPHLNGRGMGNGEGLEPAVAPMGGEERASPLSPKPKRRAPETEKKKKPTARRAGEGRRRSAPVDGAAAAESAGGGGWVWFALLALVVLAARARGLLRGGGGRGIRRLQERKGV